MALKLIIDLASHLWATDTDKYSGSQVRWKSDESDKTAFPSPDLPSSLAELTRFDMAALLQTLRYIAPYEVGADYAFERRFKSALSLMFCRYSVAFIEFVCFDYSFARRLTQSLSRDSDCASERPLP